MRTPQRVFLLLALIVLFSAVCFSQTPAKEPTASVSGHVTMGGKSAPGVTVVATFSTSFFMNKTVAKTTTDEDGNYKLAGLAAGRFTVMPLAKAYVVGTGGAFKPAGQTVNVAEGEGVTKIDFALVRAGVVTGRITDAEGHPLIGERVSIVLSDSKPDANSQMAMFGSSRNQTDDRGVYRVYGLSPGSYKVSVGQAATAGGVSIMGMGGSQYLKTFFPGVQDEAKATIIEIKEGTEVPNVDISVGKPSSGFSVSGRVIDADSGLPVPNLYIGHSTVNEANQQMGGMNFTGNQTDANGKFRLEGLRPGHYAVFTFAAGQDNSTYSEPAPFEISEGDVTGIEIKLRRGATISGVAVMENNSDPAVAGLLQTVGLGAYVEKKGLSAPSYGRSQIGADGSFRFAGMAPGKVRIFLQGFPAPPKGFTVVRTEVDGLDQPEGIEVTAGQQLKGVRLVFAYGTGSIHGEVKLESGPPPEGTMMSLTLRSAPGNSRRFTRQLELDGRFHFAAENLPPGNYELLLRPVTSEGKDAPGFEPVKQTVTVTNGADAQVSLAFDVNAKRGGGQ
jgi:protocatechuate 3,4-dioxygenase beta subunit